MIYHGSTGGEPVSESHFVAPCQSQISLSLSTVARVDVGTVRLILWDLGGQEDLQTLWDKVHDNGTHCIAQ